MYDLQVNDNTYDGGPGDISLTDDGSSVSIDWGEIIKVEERSRISLKFSMCNSSQSSDMQYRILLNGSTWKSGSIPKETGGNRTYIDFTYDDNGVQSDLIFNFNQV